MELDLKNSLSPAQSLVPIVRTESADGTGVDLLGYESAVFLFDIGDWTDGTHTFAIEESDDDSTFTAIASTDYEGTIPTAVSAEDYDDTIALVGYTGKKRYIRATTTVTGSPSTGADYAVSVLRGAKKYRP